VIKILLEREIKVQETKTNVTVNIPKTHREILGIQGGDTVIMSVDLKKNAVILKKKEG
jgi:bifunctional DNA-binding transcriptional regulator/antitoxin component of YhaV-PrlF toxin-antitoxin module